jgi:hypothetical protein
VGPPFIGNPLTTRNIIMGKNFTTAFALCLAISALPLACGDDEDDDGDGSKGGKGGSSGSSTGGRGGSAGSSTGGRGGSAGSSTGGRGGSAGSGGMTGGTAGSATGGMGGADGGMGGDDGGMGGEGGMVEPPMSLCEQVCDSPAGTCMANCVTTFCEVYYTNAAGTPTCEPLLDAMMTCWAAGADGSWDCIQGAPSYMGAECEDEVVAAYDGGCI